MNLTGTVIDAVSGQPVAGVIVTVAGASATTDSAGRFSITKIRPGSTLATTACDYSSQSLVVSSSATSPTLRLQPLPVTGTVRANLTHRGLPAAVSGSFQAKASKKGKFTVVGPCPGDKLTVRAVGYSTRTVTIPEQRSLDVVLEATPATTFEQEVAWDAAQNWKSDCSLIHPDSKAYTSVSACVQQEAKAAAQGYQAISIVVHSVTYITWTFPKCAGASFGPKTYHHVAAVRYTEQQTAPGGSVTPITGVGHFVQTKDGIWRWFPVTANCP